MTHNRFRGVLMAAAGVAALGLAGCKEEGSGRLALPDPTPAAFLSGAVSLPYAEPAPVNWYEPERGYAFAERAYGMQRAFYEAPPEYGFDYGGVQPWVWETDDDWSMFAEPYDDGYRWYYYEPDAAYPYFIRDDDYGYAYDPAGALIALFDGDGDYLPVQSFYEVAPLAGRYWLHGRDLRNAAIQAPRLSITEPLWRERAPLLVRTSAPFVQAAWQDETWRTWRDRAGRDEARRVEKWRQEAAKADRRWVKAEAKADRQWARSEARADRQWTKSEAKADRQWAKAERQAQRNEVRAVREDRGGGGWKREARAEAAADRGHPARAVEAWGGGRPDKGPKPDRGGQGHAGGKADGGGHHGNGHGGDHGKGGGGGGGNGKGGGKKD